MSSAAESSGGDWPIQPVETFPVIPGILRWLPWLLIMSATLGVLRVLCWQEGRDGKVVGIADIGTGLLSALPSPSVRYIHAAQLSQEEMDAQW